MPRFMVAVLFRGLDNFIIDEPDVITPQQAAERGLQKFKNGDAPDSTGDEWQQPERVGTITNLDTGEEYSLDQMEDPIDWEVVCDIRSLATLEVLATRCIVVPSQRRKDVAADIAVETLRRCDPYCTDQVEVVIEVVEVLEKS